MEGLGGGEGLDVGTGRNSWPPIGSRRGDELKAQGITFLSNVSTALDPTKVDHHEEDPESPAEEIVRNDID